MTDGVDGMQSRDWPRASDVFVSAALLTRLPLPLDHASAWQRLPQASWAHPLVGGVIGGLLGAVCAGLMHLGLPPLPAAALGVGAGLMLTGALHEDGLADCADGFGGGGTRERRLEIMRDSRLGTYGAAALMLALLIRAGFLAAAEPAVLVAVAAVAGAVSRVALSWAPRLMKAARPDGFGVAAGRPPWLSAALALALGAGVAVALMGWVGLFALGAAGLAAAAMGWVAQRRIGGYSGDVFGAMQVLGELAALAVLLA